MGELHLEIIVDRLKREFKVESNVGKPEVAYREAITQEGTPASTSTPSSPAAAASTATSSWRSSRGERGAGFVFENDIVGGVIPKEFIPAIEKGVREAMARGVLAGFPLVDMKCRLYDGSYHEVDSSAQAFEVAASLCFQEGAKHAGLTLLEPIMKIEVVVPEQYMGDVIGDLNSRRGRILGMSPARQRAGHRRRGSARDDVRLRDRPAVDDPGPRHVVAALLALRAGPCLRSRKRSSRRSRASDRSTTHPVQFERSKERDRHGEREIRTQQAARERRDDRSHRPRQDDADGGAGEGAVEEGSGEGRSATRTSRRAGRSATRRRR